MIVEEDMFAVCLWGAWRVLMLRVLTKRAQAKMDFDAAPRRSHTRQMGGDLQHERTDDSEYYGRREYQCNKFN